MKFKRNTNWFLRVSSLGFFTRLLFPTKVVGLETMPNEPFVLFVGPHKSAKETVLVPAYLHYYEFHILAKESLFRIPVFGWLFRKAGGIPVVRSEGQGVASVKPAVQEIEGGFPVLIFPEGTRYDEDTDMHEGRTGAVRIALETGAPIVLAANRGMTKNRAEARMIILSKPYYLKDVLSLLNLAVGKSPDGLVARTLTNYFIKELAKLSVTEYVGKGDRGDRA
jgi:1-acyl-sn-glycerol-3-phosphate acyltransferase